MGIVVHKRLRDTWRKKPCCSCALSSLAHPLWWELLGVSEPCHSDRRSPRNIWQVGGEALLPSGGRQLAGPSRGGLPTVAASACGVFHLGRSMLPGRALLQPRASGSCARFMLVVALSGGIPSGNAFVSLSGYGKGQGWVIPGNQAEVWGCLPFAIPSFLSMHHRLKI